jgi:TP901 family phage tail tape measure protein
MAVPGSDFVEAGLFLDLTDRLSDPISEAAARTEAASESIEDSAEDVDDSSAGLSTAAQRTRQFDQRMKSLRDRATEVGDRFQRVGRTAVEAGQRFALAGAAMLAPFAGAVAQSARMEEKMIDVSKTTGLAGAELDKFEEELQQIDTRTQTSQLAELAAAGGRMGVASENLTEFARQADQVGVAFDDLSAEEAGSAIGEISNVFGRDITEMGKVTDQINALSENLGAGATDILNFTKRAGQMANTMGLTEGETAALGGTLIEMGLAPERAATGFDQLLTRLNNAETLSKKARGAFQQLGIDATAMGEKMREDPKEGILEFLGAVNEAQDPVGALTQILGKRAGPKMAQLAEQSDEVARRLDRVETEAFFAGSVMSEFSKRQGTLAGETERVKKNLFDMANAIGDVLRPRLTRIASRVRDATAAAEKWISQNEELVSKLTLVGVGVGGTLAVVGTATAAFGFLAQGIGHAINFAGKFASLFASDSALMSGLTAVGGALKSLAASAGALVGGGTLAGTAVLVAIGLAIFKVWRPLAAFFKGLFSGLWDTIRPLIGTFERLWDRMRPVRRLLLALLSPVGQSVEQFENFESAGRMLGTALGWLVRGPVQLTAWVIQRTADLVQFLWNKMRSFSQWLMQANFLPPELRAATTLLESVMGGVEDAATAPVTVQMGADERVLFAQEQAEPSFLQDSGFLPPGLRNVTPNVEGTASLQPQMKGPVPSPAIEEQTAAVEAEMQGQPRQPVARRERQQGRPIKIEVRNEPEITFEGDASKDEIDQALQASEERMRETAVEAVRKELNEEKRTSF